MSKPAYIYADIIDGKTLNQFYEAIHCDFVVRGALMPDAHLGYSVPIGSVIATKDVIVPAWVGYDIGCGMCAIKTTFIKEDIIKHRDYIFNKIYKAIPTGFQHNTSPTTWEWQQYIPRTEVVDTILQDNGYNQLGSLGSGNHFIEIGYGGDDAIWIIIHSGSRNLGHKVATHYMKLASNSNKAKEGHYPLYKDTSDFQHYLTDLNFCLEFALQNRYVMLRRVIDVITTKCKGDIIFPTLINRNHNHAHNRDDLWIHRKGATHAEEGMMGVIPGNMRDGSFIVEGKGNPDALWSSSHGAGRVLSRSQAKNELSVHAFKYQMKDITAKVDNSTLDESPFAYKDIFEVMESQKDLVKVIDLIKPLINIKG